MALLTTESFDNGNTSSQIIMGGVVSVNTTGGVYNTGCAFVGFNGYWSQNYFRKIFRSQSDATSNTSLNFSLWFKAAGPPSNDGYRTIYAESYLNNVYGLGLGFRTDGRISSFSSYSSSFEYRLDDGPTNVCDNEWHFIEFNGVAASAGLGYINIYVDGKLSCTSSGVTTLYGTNPLRYDTLSFVNLVGGGCNYWIDDLTVWDQTGTTFVGYKGPVRVQTLRPISDISSINVTSTSTNNYSVLDDQNTYNISDRITISNTGNVVLELSNLDSSTQNVYGYVNFAHINSGQGGVSNVKIGNKLESTFLYSGAQTLFSQAYSTLYFPVANNFATNGILTTQNVNDLIISIDRVV